MHKNVKHKSKKIPIIRLFKRQYLWIPTTLVWGMIITFFSVIASLIFFQIHPTIVQTRFIASVPMTNDQ